MLSVIAAQNRNSPAQVVQKCAHRLIDETQCFHCDRLDNVMSLQRSILAMLPLILGISTIIIYYKHIRITHKGEMSGGGMSGEEYVLHSNLGRLQSVCLLRIGIFSM